MNTKLGRPKLPDNRARKVFPIRLSQDERQLIEEAAKIRKKKATTWAREVLLQAAKLN